MRRHFKISFIFMAVLFFLTLVAGLTFGWDNQTTQSSVDAWKIEKTYGNNWHSSQQENTNSNNKGNDVWETRENNSNNHNADNLQHPSDNATKDTSTPSSTERHCKKDEIINLVVSSLETHDIERFTSLLDEKTSKKIEAMGDSFEMTSAAGKKAASSLAKVLKTAKPAKGKSANKDSEIVNYVTFVDEEQFNFFITYDASANTWKLGGL